MREMGRYTVEEKRGGDWKKIENDVKKGEIREWSCDEERRERKKIGKERETNGTGWSSCFLAAGIRRNVKKRRERNWETVKEEEKGGWRREQKKAEVEKEKRGKNLGSFASFYPAFPYQRVNELESPGNISRPNKNFYVLHAVFSLPQILLFSYLFAIANLLLKCSNWYSWLLHTSSPSVLMCSFHSPIYLDLVQHVFAKIILFKSKHWFSFFF